MAVMGRLATEAEMGQFAQDVERLERDAALPHDLLAALSALLPRAENMARVLRQGGYGLHDAWDQGPFDMARAAIDKTTKDG